MARRRIAIVIFGALVFAVPFAVPLADPVVATPTATTTVADPLVGCCRADSADDPIIAPRQAR
jgi:hypothetical protein